MAPLKSKINHTLNRWNDKLKRQPGRSGPDEHLTAHVQQPRTVPIDQGLLLQPGQSSSHAIISLPIIPGPGPTMALPQSPGSYVYTAPSPGSPMSVDYHYHAGNMQAPASEAAPGTLANPIDLTMNSSSQVLFGSGNSHNPIDLASSPPPALPQVHGSRYTDHSLSSFMEIDDDRHRDSWNRKSSGSLDVDMPMLDYDDFAPKSRVQRRSFLRDREIAEALHDELNPGSATRSVSATLCTEADVVEFGKSIMGSICRRCKSPLVRTAETLITRTRTMLDTTGVLHPHLMCDKCKTLTCAGCKTENSRPATNLVHRITAKGFKLTWCCDLGRLFLIWSLCCGPEFKKAETVSTAASSKNWFKERLKAQKMDTLNIPYKTTTTAPGALSKGVGFGGDEYAPVANTALVDSLTSTDSSVRRAEQLLSRYFQALCVLLPSYERHSEGSPFDDDPPAVIEEMLRRSPLLPKVAELLRYDSVVDMVAREPLYDALLGFISTMGSHMATSRLVYSDLVIYPVEEQLGCFSMTSESNSIGSATFGGPSLSRGKGKQPEKGTPVVTIVANIAKQCRHLDQVGSPHLQAFEPGESERIHAFATRICALAAEHEANQTVAAEQLKATRLESTTQRQLGSNVLTRSKEAEKAREDLRELHRNTSVLDVPDDTVLSEFYFKGVALALKATAVAKGRMKKLVSQISSMRTSLPEGIWVRHGSSRLDAVKVLMIGPKGTPYEHGLFEFDMFCPVNFPNSPPMMQFRTTGRGTSVRFNPNLYEDGKVCLSLLGTWPGEPWNAAYSTLEQVLVSIHSMILVDEPWYNEPGRERTPNKPESEKYNSKIQQFTMEHALLGWLNHRLAQPSDASTSGLPAKPTTPTNLAGQGATAVLNGGINVVRDDPIWGEIIRKHFAANGKAIIETAKKWKGHRRIPNNTHAKLLGDLQAALTRHGFL